MPTREYASLWYPKFGVKKYHEEGHFGQNVSVYIIDTGLTNSESLLKHVKSRSITNSMGQKNTHGSFVASIVAAKKEYSPDKVSGIAPECQVFLADVTDAQGKIFTSYLVKAIQDAIDLHVDIISISLGTGVYDQKLENVVRAAANQGILIFAASGNCSCRTYEFPSACDEAISVASMDQNRHKSPFNTRNDSVTVFAPGQNISVPGSTKKLSGTSFAVPFASGLAALELSKRRTILPKYIMTRTEAVGFLRSTLGLTCEEHTYSNDTCSGHLNGGSFRPNETDGLSWFLLLASISGFLAFWTSSLFKTRLSGWR
jgi:subtilisin family serine protease